MSELLKIRLRTAMWAIVPVFVVVVIPAWLRRLAQEPPPGPWGTSQWLGVWLIVNGVGLSAWCANLFNVKGRGTPLPFDPPKRFIVSGPYRYVRNPMMWGVFLVLMGEVLLFESRLLLGYGLLLMAAVHAFVRLWEEPDLARRFGEDYRAYCRQVPRWIPRLPAGRRKSA